MKVFGLLGAMAILFFGGCVSVDTNIPLFYSYNFEIINASDYELEATVDGQKVAFKLKDRTEIERLRKGESAVIYLKNYSGYSAESTISVKGWYAHGEFAGAATRKIYVYGDQKQAETWIVKNETFTNSYYNWGW